jgi:rhomboid protease GluP
MIETTLASDAEDGLGPNRGKQYRLSALLLIFGLLAMGPTLKDFTPWVHGAAWPGGQAMLALGATVFFLGLGLVVLVGALRGLPHVTIMHDGIEFTTMFASKWANWNSLSPFALTTNYVGLLNRRMVTATAQVVGPEVSQNLRRKPTLILPNSFAIPLETIVARLNAQRQRTLGPAATKTVAMQDANSFGLAEFTAPWLTFVMLAALIVIFIEEQVLALGPAGPMLSPSIETLTAMGALNRELVLGGDWYRVFTAPLLHGDVSHILGNGIALVMTGFLLERLVGRAWFFSLFVIGGLGGSLASLAVNPAEATGVGASGAIMGLFAACFMSSFRLPVGITRTNLQIQSARVMIPSLLPLATAGHIDYGAHLGGAMAGAAAMFVLLKTWSDDARLPRFRGLACGVGAIGLILFGVGFTEVAIHYPHTKTAAVLIPEDQTPKTVADWQSRAAELVARFPQDPRAHAYRGFSLAQAKDYVGAERELRAALDGAENLRSFFQPKFANAIRATLAIVLSEENRWSEGKEVAQPACFAPSSERPPVELLKLLYDQHLCNG